MLFVPFLIKSCLRKQNCHLQDGRIIHNDEHTLYIYLYLIFFKNLSKFAYQNSKFIFIIYLSTITVSLSHSNSLFILIEPPWEPPVSVTGETISKKWVLQIFLFIDKSVLPSPLLLNFMFLFYNSLLIELKGELKNKDEEKAKKVTLNFYFLVLALINI